MSNKNTNDTSNIIDKNDINIYKSNKNIDVNDPEIIKFDEEFNNLIKKNQISFNDNLKRNIVISKKIKNSTNNYKINFLVLKKFFLGTLYTDEYLKDLEKKVDYFKIKKQDNIMKINVDKDSIEVIVIENERVITTLVRKARISRKWIFQIHFLNKTPLGNLSLTTTLQTFDIKRQIKERLKKTLRKLNAAFLKVKDKDIESILKVDFNNI